MAEVAPGHFAVPAAPGRVKHHKTPHTPIRLCNPSPSYHTHIDGYRVRRGGEAFLDDISRAGMMRELDDCFPYAVFGTTGGIGAFYDTLQVAAPNIRA